MYHSKRDAVNAIRRIFQDKLLLALNSHSLFNYISGVGDIINFNSLYLALSFFY